jgi:hypothetical protein
MVSVRFTADLAVTLSAMRGLFDWKEGAEEVAFVTVSAVDEGSPDVRVRDAPVPVIDTVFGVCAVRLYLEFRIGCMVVMVIEEVVVLVVTVVVTGRCPVVRGAGKAILISAAPEEDIVTGVVAESVIDAQYWVLEPGETVIEFESADSPEYWASNAVSELQAAELPEYQFMV